MGYTIKIIKIAKDRQTCIDKSGKKYNIKDVKRYAKDINVCIRKSISKHSIYPEIIAYKKNETLLASEEQKEMDELNEILSQEIEGQGEISPYAGKTSKHGWVYPNDYRQYGDRDVDNRSDVEAMFDDGLLTEEEYNEFIDALKVTGHYVEDSSKAQAESPSLQESVDDLAKRLVEQDKKSSGNTSGGSTTPSTGGGSSNPPGTPGYDPATYIPEGPTYVPDGRISY